MAEPEKMALTSMGIAEEKREELKRCLGEAFPEVFAEGAIDFEQLRRVLGDWVESGKERFGLNWPGKAECMKIIQQPSVATLKPVRDESVNFDDTENLFIEGDNLEVVKLLQKAYFGKVEMIALISDGIFDGIGNTAQSSICAPQGFLLTARGGNGIPFPISTLSLDKSCWNLGFY